MNAVLPEFRSSVSTDRLARVVARLRRRQLELALAGEVTESARFARRVKRLSRKGERSATACGCGR